MLSGPENPIRKNDPPVDPADEELLQKIAVMVVRRGLAVPAVFFLESTKPLSFLGSQALVFLEPFVKSFLNIASYDRFVSMMEDRKNIEKLITRIEDLDEEARVEEKRRGKAEKEARRIAAAAGVPREPLGRRVWNWFRGK